MRFYVTKGIGVCEDGLVSFDRALQTANLGNYNLVKISSILPPNTARSEAIDAPEGTFLHTAYSVKQSKTIGANIFALIAVGIPMNSNKIGVIMEYSGEGDIEEGKKRVAEMVTTSMGDRGIAIREIVIDGVNTTVQNAGGITTVLAAISIW